MAEPRRGIKGWFAHAFAVDKPQALEPTPEQREIVDRLCAEVVRRRLATPALMALEMSRPLNTFGAAALHMFQPIIGAVMNPAAIEQFARLLEHRGSIDFLCQRIEHFQKESRITSDD